MRGGGAVVLVAGVLGCQPAPVDLGGPVIPGPAPLPDGTSGACTGAPTTLAQVAHIQPRPLAIDDWNLYVVAASASDPAKQELWRVPKTGGAPQRLASNQDPIVAIVVGDETADQTSVVFWTTNAAAGDGGDAGDAGAAGAVWTVGPQATDAPVPLAPNRWAPGALLVLNERVYWAEEQVDSTGQTSGAIVWAPTSGGPVETLQITPVDQLPRAFGEMASSGEASLLLWTTADPTLGNEAEAEVVGCAELLPFGRVTRFATAETGGAGALVPSWVDSIVYSGPTGIDEIGYAADGGFSARTRVVATQGFVGAVEESDEGLYFVDPATRALTVVATDGSSVGAPRRLVAGVDPGLAFQVDWGVARGGFPGCVYWIDASAQSVMMVKEW